MPESVKSLYSNFIVTNITFRQVITIKIIYLVYKVRIIHYQQLHLQMFFGRKFNNCRPEGISSRTNKPPLFIWTTRGTYKVKSRPQNRRHLLWKIRVVNVFLGYKDEEKYLSLMTTSTVF